MMWPDWERNLKPLERMGNTQVYVLSTKIGDLSIHVE